jgi:hypothetical protein
MLTEVFSRFSRTLQANAAALRFIRPFDNPLKFTG